jgi:ornithine cyclodeaminase/alanine dehydrogenase-like protein (mu-crystallin family)
VLRDARAVEERLARRGAAADDVGATNIMGLARATDDLDLVERRQRRPQRRRVRAGPRLFKSTGMAWEDAVVAAAVVRSVGA